VKHTKCEEPVKHTKCEEQIKEEEPVNLIRLRKEIRGTTSTGSSHRTDNWETFLEDIDQSMPTTLVMLNSEQLNLSAFWITQQVDIPYTPPASLEREEDFSVCSDFMSSLEREEE
jgi:hypothetical protein